MTSTNEHAARISERSGPDPRPGRIAAALGVSRAIARGLLALDYTTRNDLLREVVRVDAHSQLAWLRVQPSTEAA